ncbi:MAG: NYN domain-containing protein [Patescibacteria group bacterium]
MTASIPSKTAIFIDYENTYWSIKQKYFTILDPDALTRALRDFVNARYPGFFTMYAYADFENPIFYGLQTRLQQKTVITRHVYGHHRNNNIRKNASDLELSLEALELTYVDPTFDRYVLVSGDRDFIPLVRKLKNRGKAVSLIAISETTSQDLMEVVEGDFHPLNELLDLTLPRDEAGVEQDEEHLEILIRCLSDLENSNLPFISLKYFTQQILPFYLPKRIVFDLAKKAILSGILHTCLIDNPNNPKRKTTAIKLNHEHEMVQRALTTLPA